MGISSKRLLQLPESDERFRAHKEIFYETEDSQEIFCIALLRCIEASKKVAVISRNIVCGKMPYTTSDRSVMYALETYAYDKKILTEAYAQDSAYADTQINGLEKSDKSLILSILGR